MKILAINGSPKKNVERSATYFLLQKVLEGAKGAETELLNLSEYNLLHCNGCEICVKDQCPLDKKDDFPKIEEKLLEADAIIFGSPSYFGVPSGLMKTLMDRSRDLKMPESKLAGKIASAVSVAGLRVGGQVSTIDALVRFALGQGMIIVGALGHPWFNAPFPMGTLQYDLEGKAKFRKINDDPLSTKDAVLLGERITAIGKKLTGGK
ncbi:MAG: flavodoxin family protein [Candidatus Hermodarchaeota archaeon]